MTIMTWILHQFFQVLPFTWYSSADDEDGLKFCVVKIADWQLVNLLFMHGKWKLY